MILRPFSPGASPCGDACPLDWAAEAAGAPVRDARPVTVPEGAVLSWMSYARDGQPYGGSASYYAASNLTGVGYRLPGGAWFVRLDACGNWTVAHFVTAAGAFSPPAASAAAPSAARAGAAVEQAAPAITDCRGVSCVPPVSTPGGSVGAEIPPPIPLPASGLLLVAAVVALALFRSRRV